MSTACFSFSPAVMVAGSLNATNKPSTLIGTAAGKNIIRVSHAAVNKFQSFELKATGKDGVKVNSILCSDCEGNGAIVCKQCKGDGVNSEDHFNGRFKAGGLCWLCRGKREILCGNCNGAGFCGGFMSTAD